MAGVKGRSGGARPNTGGARAGAGAKKKPAVLIPALLPATDEEPESLRLMRQIMNDTSLDAKIRLDAAKALAPFESVRKGDSGKKDAKGVAAKRASVGKFAPAAPPKLVATGGKIVK